MILHMQGSATVSAGVCADCGAPANGNFCASCGADLRESALGFLGRTVAPVRRSFPVVYLKLLRAPDPPDGRLRRGPELPRPHLVRARRHRALRPAVRAHRHARGAYPRRQRARQREHADADEGAVAGRHLRRHGHHLRARLRLFRFFATVQRPFHAYFKLYCLALGFIAPIYGVYEFVVRGMLGGIGMSSLGSPMKPRPTGCSRRRSPPSRWRCCCGPTSSPSIGASGSMPVWKATSALSSCASFVSNRLGLLAHVVGRLLSRRGFSPPPAS